jgi:methionyl-tRNA formyltransferase
VRAFYPWPGSYTRWRGQTLKVIEAAPLSPQTPVTAKASAKAGEVVALDSGGFGIGTGDGVLNILKVQLAGKHVLAAAEFSRGQRGFIGVILPSDS